MRTCQNLGIPSIGLDELRLATSPSGKADMRYMADLARAGHFLMLRFDSREQHFASPEQKYVQIQSPYVAQAAWVLELWDWCSRGCRSLGHFAVASGSFAGCSCVTLSLRRHIECLVRRSRTGITRDGTLRPRFQLLLPASDLFVGFKARRNTTPCHLHGVSPPCRIAERCAKERYRIAQARAR